MSDSRERFIDEISVLQVDGGQYNIRESVLKAREVVREYAKGTELKEGDFGDIYSPEEIKRDIDTVEKFEARFEERRERATIPGRERDESADVRSEAMECSIAYHGEMSEWFGEGAYMIRTTRYDNIVNGEDLVWEREGARLALGIDTTTARSETIVGKKITRNIEKLRRGKAEIKYFQSMTDPKVRGDLKSIIPVVIGLDSENTEHFLDSLFAFIVLGKLDKRTEIQDVKYKILKREISESPAQMVFLEEIIAQLNMYQEVLSHELSADILQEITCARQAIIEILSGKVASGLSKKEFQGDKTLGMISLVCRRQTLQAATIQ